MKIESRPIRPDARPLQVTKAVLWALPGYGGGASGNANAYTGRELDETSLYFYRARYYDPRIQRFISEDPSGPKMVEREVVGVIRQVKVEGLAEKQADAEVYVPLARLAISFGDRQTRNPDRLASPAFQDVLEDEIAPGQAEAAQKHPSTDCSNG